MNNYPLRSKKRAEGVVFDLTAEDSDDNMNIAAKRSNKKSRRRVKSKQPISTKDDDATSIKPEHVTSSGDSNKASETAFDEKDFEVLRQRYLLPRIQLNTELPTGMTLRRTCKPRLIDLKTPGFQRLRVRIDELTKQNDRGEVYRLLCQVRSYEIDPSRVPAVMQERNQDGDVNEVFDLTQDNDDGGEKECYNVDEYITDVLLPRDGTDSKPDRVLSASLSSGKVVSSALSSPRMECMKEEPPEPKNATVENATIETQKLPATPKATHNVAQVTPEKPLDHSASQMSASPSPPRSFTSTITSQTPVKSINKSVHYGLGDHCQLQRVFPRNEFDEQAYRMRMKGRNNALAKRTPIVARKLMLGTTSLGKSMRQRHVCVMNVPMKLPPRLFVASNKPSQISLAKEWRSQSRRRKKGGESCFTV